MMHSNFSFVLFLILVHSWESSCFRRQQLPVVKLRQHPQTSSWSNRMIAPQHASIRSSPSSLKMAFDTFVNVKSNFEAHCTLKADKGVSLTDYMKLPVDQYVCIQMPLNATLERLEGNTFNLTVPPVRFFFLDVSPMLFCNVAQDATSVHISSDNCILRGAPYVKSLNGCFKIMVSTTFKWIDTPRKKSIMSNSVINVAVDPPAPYKFFGKTMLERTGTLAMSLALRQIENAFVQALARDYERWANDATYREARKIQSDLRRQQHDKQSYEVDVDFTPPTESAEHVEDIVESATQVQSPADVAVDVDDILEENALDMTEEMSSSGVDAKLAALPDKNQTVVTTMEPPRFLVDSISLLPGAEPEVKIEIAPHNARRIYTGVDIIADIEDVWRALTNYESLHQVVPSLLSNEVLWRDDQGGARLLQIGGAKVLPGITFKAKTLVDVNLYTEDNPIPPHMISNCTVDLSNHNTTSEELVNYRTIPIERGVFPCPQAYPNLPYRDITMEDVPDEGDFEHYQGVWRMQSLSERVTRLTYAVEIKPRGFVPVYLIESRIAEDLKSNLDAIRKFVEANAVSTAAEGDAVAPVESTKLHQENHRLKKRVEVLEEEVRTARSALSSIKVILDAAMKRV